MVNSQSKLPELESLVQAVVAESGEKVQASADESERLYLARLARGPLVRTVGEIGFNAGFSSLNFLEADDDLTIVSFDIGDHDYVDPAKRFIDEHFPGRHELIVGDSTSTVPVYAQDNPGHRFDLVFIDGGHEYEVAKADLENMRALSHEDTIVVMDDTLPWQPWGEGPYRAWNEAVDVGSIVQDELLLEGRVVDSIEPFAPEGVRAWARGRYVLNGL